MKNEKQFGANKQGQDTRTVNPSRTPGSQQGGLGRGTDTRGTQGSTTGKPFQNPRNASEK